MMQAPELKPHQLYQNFRLQSNTDTIRLLEFGAERCDYPNTLTATFRIADLKQCPSYAALSYVWGQYSPTAVSIHVNGCKLELTRDCYEALLALSTRRRQLLIWVDSICINQQDDHERSSQVALMGKIYTWARPTFVWLGSATEDSDKAVQILQHASALRVRPPGVPWSQHGKGGLSPRRDRLALIIRVIRNYYSMQFGSGFRAERYLRREHDFKVLERILIHHCDWLKRSWTFQEIILADDPVLLLGSRCIPWAQFIQALDFLCDPVPIWQTWWLLRIFNGLYARNFQYNGELDPWKSLVSLWANFPRKAELGSDKEGGMMSAAKYRAFYVDRGYLEACFYIPGFAATFLLLFFLYITLWGLYQYGAIAIAMIGGSILCSLVTILILVMWPNMKDIVWSVIGDPQQAIMTEVFSALRNRRSSVPHDKVFALRGILDRLDHPPQQSDYAETVGKIYEEFFVGILHRYPTSINLLFDAGIGSLDAPSWVPDWSRFPKKTWVPEFYMHLTPPVIGSVLYSLPSFEVADGRLILQGRIEGQITILCDMLGDKISKTSERRIEEHGIDDLLLELLSLSDFAMTIEASETLGQEKSGPHSRTRERIWGAIYASGYGRDLTWSFEGEEKQLLQSVTIERTVHQGFDKWYEAMDNLLNQELGRANLWQHVNDLLKSHEVQDFVRDCRSRLGDLRCLFYSSDHTIGTGSLNAQISDCIAIVRGVSLPLLLRPVENSSSTFQLVGPAFEEGLVSLYSAKQDGEWARCGPINLV